MVALAASCLACNPAPRLDRHTRQLLDELDGFLSAKEMYFVREKDELQAMRRLIGSIQEPEHRYELEMSMADAAFAYSFDTTQAHLQAARDLALALKDDDRYHQASIRLGHLYAKSGHYIEAYNLLYNQIDTAALSSPNKTEYLVTLYDFGMDLRGNSGLADQLVIPPVEPLRHRLLGILEPDSRDWRTLQRDEFFDEGKLDAADSLARVQLSGARPEEHAYAIYAFHVSEIANAKGNQAERFTWLVKSAESDIINAVRDYASLTMVAQSILPQDVDRSFRYLRIAQEDALQYNAKLRPWQISRFLIEVEDAYTRRLSESRRYSAIASILLAVLVAALSVIAWFLVARSRKLSRTRQELEESNVRLAAANEQLSEMNREISEANALKEKNILGFLEGLSAQISLFRSEDNRYRNLLKQGKADQLLKELSINGRAEKTRDEFYETFDALIFLGVEDSKKIASMLDYSLSTIYNRKVAVKNAALDERDGFEERVKNLRK